VIKRKVTEVASFRRLYMPFNAPKGVSHVSFRYRETIRSRYLISSVTPLVLPRLGYAATETP
jgi:predicted component of type VI protein secretion system